MSEAEIGGYQILERLAVGGMAEVYRARAKTAQKSAGEPEEVALKRLLPVFRADGAYVKQFVDEAKLTVKLRHPNIVRTYRCFKAGVDYLMVQELVSGATLEQLQESRASGAPLSVPAAVYITLCVTRALEHVHGAKLGERGASIVHRDVNPSNVLLSREGDVKLTDFGVADVEGMMKGEAGALRGTVAYMSPEQVLGLPVDHRSDVYSLGIILWELLANTKLHTGASPMEVMHRVRDGGAPILSTLRPSLPTYVVQVVRKALFVDKNLRFQSAAELRAALEALAAREGWTLGAETLRPLCGA